MTYRKEQLTGEILGIEAGITSSAASEKKVLDDLMRMEARFNAKQDETLDELKQVQQSLKELEAENKLLRSDVKGT